MLGLPKVFALIDSSWP